MTLKRLFIFFLYICIAVCDENMVKSFEENLGNSTATNKTAIGRRRPSTDFNQTNTPEKVNQQVSENVLLDSTLLKNNKIEFIDNHNKTKDTAAMVAPNTTKTDNTPIKSSTNISLVSTTPTTTTTTAKTTPTTTTAKTTTTTTTAKTTTSTTTDKTATTTTIVKSATSSTTAQTITPKPKKPLIAHSIEEYPEYMVKLHESNHRFIEDLGAPIPPETEPVRDASARMHTDMFVPLITIMFTIPLAAGVLITTYRRFRDCWSTRHYRRMDFLVDGMYND